MRTPTSLYTVAQIRALEQLAPQKTNTCELMQLAGRAAFKALIEHWPKLNHLWIFCGKGNNGGDGYVVATLAKACGLTVCVRYVGQTTNLPESAAKAYQAACAANVDIKPYDANEVISPDIIVDALLGIGLNADVKPPYADAIATINQAACPVFALDVPSGIDADTGRVCGVAVRASRTLTFIGIKRGLVTGEAPAYCGELDCSNLGLSAPLLQTIPPAAEILSSIIALPPRQRDAHKGDFGHVLVIGGNYGMGGAVQLAATAALRVGAGLVSVATRPEHISALLAARPEIMAHAVTDATQLHPLLARASVIVLGPGLGKDAWANALYNAAMTCELPLVIDADALNLLAQSPINKANWVLTPHPGEAARLLQISTLNIQADRYLAAQQLQKRYGGVVVLKGVGTLIHSEAQTRVCIAGNPGMASGGMGDVLAGIIGGLVAQHIDLQKAAELGVALHAQAADKAAEMGEHGLLALDVVAQLQGLVR